MIIKKFTGKTEGAALEAAKKELGNGVVVMNVKNVNGKGLLAALRPKMVEVTVALEEEKMAERPVVRETMAKSASEDAGRMPVSLNAHPDSSQNIEKKLDSLQTLLESRLQQTNAQSGEPEAAKPSEEGAAEQEDKPGAEAEQKEENPEQEKFIRLLYNAMIESDVNEKYANQILEEIERSKKPNIPIDYILANIYQKMILKFGKTEGITPSDRGPKVVMFLGPTGVGKTTTIAKIASHYAVEEKKKVALVTADTYRIAAAEQLRTYANILEVPFRVIYTEEELKEAVENFKGFDYIFVDTAGHSHQNEEQLEKMKGLLAAANDVARQQSFLVLSAGTKYKDLKGIAERYKKVADYQLIFTKLDETLTLGNLLNLKLYTDAPIAYVTYGQNVPNDIERFNPQKTVKQLLGGKSS